MRALCHRSGVLVARAVSRRKAPFRRLLLRAGTTAFVTRRAVAKRRRRVAPWTNTVVEATQRHDNFDATTDVCGDATQQGAMQLGWISLTAATCLSTRNESLQKGATPEWSKFSEVGLQSFESVFISNRHVLDSQLPSPEGDGLAPRLKSPKGSPTGARFPWMILNPSSSCRSACGTFG